MKKYSVIIPAYNAEPYLPPLLTFVSTITNVRNDVEFIIINDGSKDNTQNILDKLPFTNLIIHHQKNKGVSAARNKGIELATGTYILFLDADDTYSINIFDVLDQNIKKPLDLLLFNFSISNKETNNPSQKIDFDKLFFFEMFTRKKLNTHICSICINRDYIIYNKLYFPEGYTFGEDIYYIMQAILNTKKNVTYIPTVLFNYQLENSGTVASPINLNKIKVLKLYESLEPNNPSIANNIEYFIQRTYLYLIKLSIKFGVDKKSTKTQLLKNLIVLKKKSNTTPPLDFKIAKIVILIFKKIIFKKIKVLNE